MAWCAGVHLADIRSSAAARQVSASGYGIFCMHASTHIVLLQGGCGTANCNEHGRSTLWVSSKHLKEA